MEKHREYLYVTVAIRLTSVIIKKPVFSQVSETDCALFSIINSLTLVEIDYSRVTRWQTIEYFPTPPGITSISATAMS